LKQGVDDGLIGAFDADGVVGIERSALTRPADTTFTPAIAIT